MLSVTNASSQLYDWVIYEGGTSDENSRRIVKDSQDNLLVIGNSDKGNAVIGPNILPPILSNLAGNFIAKYDDNQNLLWAINPVNSATPTSGGSSSDMTFYDITVDNNDEFIIAGEFRGIIDLGGISMTSFNEFGMDFFLAKFDANGNCLWAKHGGDPQWTKWSQGWDVETDDNNNIFFVGKIDGTSTVEGTNITTAGATDYCILSYTSAGAHRWTKSFGTANHDGHGGIAIGPNNNVYFAGDMGGNSVNIDGTIYNSANGNKLMIAAKFDNNGNTLWVNQTDAGNTVGFNVRDILVNSNGEAFISADHPNAASPIFSNGSTPFPTWGGGNTPFIYKLGTTGNFMWAKRYGNFNSGWAALQEPMIGFDDCGEYLYIYAYFSGPTGSTAIFDNDTLFMPTHSPPAGANGQSYYVAKMDPASGGFIWVYQMDSLVRNTGTGAVINTQNFVVDESNKLILLGNLGTYDGDVELWFGNTPYQNNINSRDYWVAYFNLNSVIWEVNSNPDTICQPQPVELTVDSAFLLDGSQFVWYEDSCGSPTIVGYGDTITVNPIITTTYYVRAEGPCDTSNCDSVTVTYIGQTGNPTVIRDTICPGSNLTLYPSIANQNYSWSDASTLDSLIINTKDTFWVDISFLNCVIRDSFLIEHRIVPTGSLKDTTYCPGDSVELIAPNPTASTYLWNTTETTNSIKAFQTGIYWVDQDFGGCAVRDSFDVTPYNISPGVTINANLCPNQSILLYATPPGALYSWQDATTNQVFTTTLPGTYWVDVTVGGCTKRDSFLVSNSNVPPGIVVDSSVCLGQSVTFDAFDASATSYLWHDLSSSNSYSTSLPGTYWVEKSIAGCTITDTFHLSTQNGSVIDTIMCPGQTINLDATYPNATGYAWQDGSASPIFNVNVGGVYWVDITTAGCTWRDTFNVDTISNGIFTDTASCGGAALTIGNYIAGATYTWNNGQITPNITVNNAGIYWVDINFGTCSRRDTFDVSIQSTPIGTFTDSTVCPNIGVFYDVFDVSASGYLWDDGTTGSSNTLTTPGVHYVDVNYGGCIKRDTFEIIHYPFTPGTVVNATLCPNQSILLYATPTGASYNWQDGSSSQFFTTNAIGTYWVDVSQFGCSKRDTFIVAQSPVNNPLVIDTSICPDSTLVLNPQVNSGTGYNWSDGTTTISNTVSTIGTYYVSYNLGNCYLTDTFHVTNFRASKNEKLYLCSDGQILLDATQPNAVYVWSDGSTNPSLQVTNMGTYYATVTMNGCAIVDTFTVNQNGQGVADNTTDTTVCAGNTIDLIPSPSSSSGVYLWSTGSADTAIYGLSTGIYWVDIFVNGCLKTDTFVVRNKNSNFDLGTDTTICASQEHLLEVSIDDALYSWNTGSVEQSILIQESGKYEVTVTDECGSWTDEIDISTKNCNCYLYVPDAFSPNQDGLNDNFSPTSHCNFIEYEFKIFNRWGDLIFEAENETQTWDGTYMGKSCQTGVYIWRLKYQYEGFSHLKTESKYGTITILQNTKF
jgi:gliding motility-associated-like protein